MKKMEFMESEKDFFTEEAYNSLRTNIIFCGADIKTISITSCFPNEGKSSVSRNLAINFAKAEKKVLLIDADMRKSVTMGIVDTEGAVCGLSHFLSGQAELDDVIYSSRNNENLFVIFTGSFPPNPSELLSGERFKKLIQEARKCFDYVIVDTPPLGAVIDAAVVSSVCDGAIIVVRANKTSYKDVKAVKLQLEKANCKILGTVLNGAESKGNSYYYNEYYKS